MGYRRATIALIWAHAAVMLAAVSASAQTVVKVGLISSYSGFVAQAADEAQKGIDLYLKEHERDLSPGVKVELIRRDDTSNPEVGKRLAQELITREQVQLLTGIVLSPVAAAIAPLTAEAKVPLLISIAAAGVAIPRMSPYVARVTVTLWQLGYPIGKWAAEQGWKKVTRRSATSSPATIRKRHSPRALPMAAGKLSGPFAFRPTTPILRPSHSVSGTPNPMSPSCGFPPALKARR
jgi:branched-chain amino acid transport system substrate-binding protein